MNRNQRRAAAKSAGLASSGRATTPAALCELGFALLKSGQVAEADSYCRQALALQPDFADGLHLMGVIAFSRQQYDHAVEWIAGALRREPKSEYLLSIGHALQFQGRLEEALKAYDKGVALTPDEVELWKNMGFVLAKLDRTDDAILALQHTLKLGPRHKEAAHMCAMLLLETERYDEAIACYDVCAELEPDRADVYQNRGLCHERRSRFEQAVADYERALRLDPDRADTYHNLGVSHLKLGRYDAASYSLDRALALDPARVVFLVSKGFLESEQNRFTEAIAAYDRALAIEPGHAGAQWNLSLLNMLTGNFAAGWTGREARWHANIGMVERNFTQPAWLGQEPIAGKTILLHADEGIGDAIQFSRYVPMVAALGARVILEVQQPVHPLLALLPGLSHSQPHDCPVPDFDLHCPLSSLPLAFQTRLETIPAPVSCLPSIPKTLADQWESWLGPHDCIRVGLVWSGNQVHKNDRNRSTTLQALSSILGLDATFVSLQKDPREQDRITLRQCADIMDASEQLTDFLATAALVSCLDLVITVDTSVAHLAGMLGRPVWIMLPFTPDYRWLLDRDDSPWYPTARLFRQTGTRDYAPVVERMRRELQRLVAARRPTSGVAQSTDRTLAVPAGAF
jgi:tetratricopeptide (TPR) repeat protein